MTKGPLSSLNLNLLRTLDVLLEERNVTRAADRLGVTQSAVSHALRQLRRRLADPLLVREGAAMALTPRAESLREPLRRGLLSLERALDPGPALDPAEAEAELTLAAPEDIAFVLLPRLVLVMGKVAPRVRIAWRAVSEAPSLAEHGSGGLALSLLPSCPGASAEWETKGLSRKRLYRERVVCVMRERNPLAGRKLSAQRFADAEHILVPTAANGLVERAVDEAGQKWRRLPVSSLAVAGEMVAQGDALMTLPERAAERLAARHRLLLRPFPFGNIRYKVRMHWHPSLEEDPLNRLLRDELRASAEG